MEALIFKRVVQPDAAHGHPGRCSPGFDPEFGKHTLQMFFYRHRAGAKDVADIAIDLALDHPIQHLGFTRR